MPKTVTVSPSSIYSNNRLGSIVYIGGKKHVFVARDPWKATFARYYWVDERADCIVYWLRSFLLKVKEKYASKG